MLVHMLSGTTDLSLCASTLNTLLTEKGKSDSYKPQPSFGSGGPISLVPFPDGEGETIKKRGFAPLNTPWAHTRKITITNRDRYLQMAK
jgi:hypothetical protein